MTTSIKMMIPWGAVLALTLAGAGAQTPGAPATSQPPAAIGVSPQTAAEANQKAVPRSDTGTVVRTAPSAAERARSAVENRATSTTTTTTSGRSASGTLDTSGASANTGATAGNANAVPPDASQTSRSADAARDSAVQTAVRHPRADRN